MFQINSDLDLSLVSISRNLGAAETLATKNMERITNVRFFVICTKLDESFALKCYSCYITLMK